MKKWILGLALLLAIPATAAQTISWQAILGDSSSAAPAHVMFDFDPFTDGSVLIGFNTGFRDSIIQRYTSTGGISWTGGTGTSCQNSVPAITCTVTAVHVDAGHRAVYVQDVNSATPSTFLYWLNGDDGTSVGGKELSAMSPAFTEDVRSISSYMTPGNNVMYIVGTGSGNPAGTRLALINATTGAVVWNIGVSSSINYITTEQYTSAVPTNFYTVAGNVCEKRDIATGLVTAGTAGSCGGTSHPAGQYAKLGQNDATKLYNARCNGGTNVESYQRVVAATMLQDTGSPYTLTGTNPDSLTPRCASGFDVAGDDNLLLCGQWNSGAALYVGLINTATNVYTAGHTSFLVPTYAVGSDGDKSTCRFDNAGGFHEFHFVTKAGKQYLQATRFTGYSTPFPQYNVDLNPSGGGGPTTTPPAGNTNNPLGQTVNYVSNAWGIATEVVLWLVGLVLVGLFLWRFRDANTLLIAVMAFLVIGFAVALGLFPEWLLFVLVFLIIAVAGHRLFGGKSQDEGGD